MMLESLLSTIEGLIAIGLGAGLLVGLITNKPKLGFMILSAVPIAMIFYVSWWQGRGTENLNSTSALDYLFGPLWPSLGAIAGFHTGNWLRQRIIR